jgi:hypothetical protein
MVVVINEEGTKATTASYVWGKETRHELDLTIHDHHHHLHGLGFLKVCSAFKITYKSCLKLNPMKILKLFSPSSTWTSLVSSASGFVVQ